MAEREQPPIPDVTLVSITTKLLLQDQAFTPEMKELEKKHPVNKTWFLWKLTFLKAHEGLQRHIQACGGSDQFFSANSASVAANPSRSFTIHI